MCSVKLLEKFGGGCLNRARQEEGKSEKGLQALLNMERIPL